MLCERTASSLGEHRRNAQQFYHLSEGSNSKFIDTYLYTESAPSPSPVEAVKPGEDSTENAPPRGTTPDPVPRASPSPAVPSTEAAEDASVETQANDSVAVDTAEPMDVGHRECGAEGTSALDLPSATKADAADVEMPESSPSRVEGDPKDRDLERGSEKPEPGGDDPGVAQQMSAPRPELPSDHDSSATCSADEDVDGEPERQR